MASPTGNKGLGRLRGKRCLVTAAAQGIGRTTVETFLREGADLVVAVDFNGEKLKKLQSLPGVDLRVIDVRDGPAIRKLSQQLDTIDVLFNCAGYVHAGNILETTEERWDYSFDVNVKSMYYFITAFLPKMIAKGKGSIINMSSAASTLRGIEARCVYGASKAAVIGLTKGVARDFVRLGIRHHITQATCLPSMEDSLSEMEVLLSGNRIEKKRKSSGHVL
ncbi:dehydrogenase/reductase SDR family member 6-like isoform X2 [Macrobrachium nipponense]|uniref:dehydrogenase/reductase SDR family member 6-like isoform X2 n=1 Tax=Macrobrachium nipponense TaxID=159736 RepID=UPI0030C7BFE2